MNLVNKLVLGTVQFGCQYGINSVGKPSVESVARILEEAWKRGINILDTSSGYGDAERVLGKTIGRGTGFKIISKYPRCSVPVEHKLDLTLQDIKKVHLYGYLLHHFEVYRNNPEIWHDFVKLKLDGKVEKIGFSLYEPEELERILNDRIPFGLLQVPYNILDRKFEPYFPVLHDMGVEIHVRSTFLQGLFFMDRDKLPVQLRPLREYLLKLDAYASMNDLTTGEVALNFNLQNPNIDGILIGVDTLAQLQSNLDAVKNIRVDIEIDVQEKELLNPVNWK